MRQDLVREVLAECLGTFVLIVFGVAVVAQTVLSGQTAGSPLAINIGWGLAVTMACYVSAGVSGAHLNPAVTVALAVHRRFPCSENCALRRRADGGRLSRVGRRLRDVSRGAGRVRRRDAAGDRRDGHRRHLGDVSRSRSSAPFPGGFIDQVVGTALLVGVIFAITDTRSSPPPAGTTPVVVGLLVLLIGMTFGFNSGYAINPARDFAPRVFTAIAGWGSGVFRAGHGWWWVPVVAPCVGGVLGGCDLRPLRRPPLREVAAQATDMIKFALVTGCVLVQVGCGVVSHMMSDPSTGLAVLLQKR